jgi:hypothetical protein
VDTINACTEASRRGDYFVGEVTRATDVDVGVVQVSDETAHRSLVKSHLVARPAEFVVAALATFDHFGEFFSVDDVRGALRTDDNGDFGRRWKILEQCAKRRDADASPDQHDATGLQSVASERSVGTFDDDSCAGPQASNRAALVAETLDGHA